jgi:hypothetical protein
LTHAQLNAYGGHGHHVHHHETITATIAMMPSTTMHDDRSHISPLALLGLQSWLSPAFPIGTYSYSHGIEWAVVAGHVRTKTITATIAMMPSTTMHDDWSHISPLALLRLQSWLSPAFPIDDSLVEWPDADLRYGAGRKPWA